MKTVLFFIFLFVILGFVSKDWKTIKRVLGSWGLIELSNFFYDFPFWAWMQSHFGVVLGSTYASLGALVMNLGLIIWYQSTGEDWLGVNLLEQLKKEGEDWMDRLCDQRGLFLKVALFIPVYLPAKIFKLVVWSLNKTELTTFLVFTIFTDSFYTTIFMRHGRFGRLDKRDMGIFLLSTVISCVTWSMFNATLITIVRLFLMCWRNTWG